MTEYAACLGIDWADKKHDLCLFDAATGKKTRQVLPHTPQAIAEYFSNLRVRYCGQQIAVGLEQSRGPLLFALLQYDFLVLYPINPSTLARYREAFSPSRAKDDPTDAEYAAELLMQHRDRLKAWHPDDDQNPHAALSSRASAPLSRRPHPPQQPHNLAIEMLLPSGIVVVS